MELKVVSSKSELLKKMLSKIDSSSVLMLMFLANNADSNGQTKVSLSELKEQFSMYPPNISRKLNDLAKMGLLKIDKVVEEGTNTLINVYTVPPELEIFKGWLK